MTDLGRRMMNGVVSDTPVVLSKREDIPATSSRNNVIDIPDFMKAKRRLSTPHQNELYEQARISRWQKLKRKVYLLFFYEE